MSNSEEKIPVQPGKFYAVQGDTIVELANYLDEIPFKIAARIHQILDKKLQIIPIVAPPTEDPIEKLPEDGIIDTTQGQEEVV